MKAELKLFIRQVIEDQLDKWNEDDSQNRNHIPDVNPPPNTYIENNRGFLDMDESNVELLHLIDNEKDQNKIGRYKTLIRIGIEFCVTIQDPYFLFYDLFIIF